MLMWLLRELPQADFDRRRVRTQPLGVRDGDGGRPEAPNVAGTEREDGRDLEEIVQVEWRAEAGRTAGRHDVARAGHVVADRLGRPLADEDAAGILDLPEPRPGVPHAQRQVLRGV